MTEWQPIETAPKDGTPVLVTDGAIVAIAVWDERMGFWNQEGYGSYDGGAGRTYGMKDPTLWQPLPAPPTE